MKNLNKNMLFEGCDDISFSPLYNRFGVPPFSVLDTTQGFWQNRVKQWKSFGIESEIGRSADLLPKLAYLNNYGVGFKNIGVSVFDPVLCELMYSWFIPSVIEKSNVLDCFAGGSVRGIVAGVLGKNYIGVDLREEQVNENKRQWDNCQLNTKNGSVEWICGDSKDIVDLLGDNRRFDFLFSCPPYYDLEVYSDDKNDLSNLDSYDDFVEKYSFIISKSCSLLKEDRFAVFVVSEIRDQRTGLYRGFVEDTIKAFENAGLVYYNDIVLLNSCGTLPIRTTAQFNASRKVGRRHQNVLVFYKGNPKNIKNVFGEVVLNE